MLLKNRSFQVAVSITLYLLLAPFLPDFAHQGLYTISLMIKEILLWFLPFTVCFFIGYAIISFEKKAPLFILTLFLFEAVSNACSVWYAYGFGFLATSNIDSIQPQVIQDTFAALWRLPFTKPAWWSPDKGATLGVLLGLLCTFTSFPKKSFFSSGKRMAERVLTRFFARLIPLFILGFIARMYKTNMVDQIVTHYADLLIWLVIALLSYIAILFLLGGGKGVPNYTQRIKNLLPAFGISFSSGCSLSTMPWTISGTSKNLKNPDLAGAIIPSTTNIQQIGDCIINSFFCFIIFYHFNGYKVDILTWASFSAVFVLARFATAAVLGGAVFIMLPIYEAYLGFTPEMIAMILAFNVILDPLVTCTNVISNGALCRVFERIWRALSERLEPQRHTTQ
jgi:hypothetical protein